MKSRSLLVLAGVLVCLVTGCATPLPNDLVILDVPGAKRFALSTEDGIIALDGDDLGVSELPLAFWYKGSLVLDNASVESRTENLGLLAPRTSRLQFAEIAGVEPEKDEDLYIQLLEMNDPEKLPYVVDAHLYADGRFGDLLEVDDWFTSCEFIAGEFAGAGVYAKRKGRYLLVGIINGTVCSNPDPSRWVSMFGPCELLPFIGLEGIAPILPKTSNFFERRVRAFRPDFEYGLERDGREPNSANR